MTGLTLDRSGDRILLNNYFLLSSVLVARLTVVMDKYFS